jgi:hypothetical protein
MRGPLLAVVALVLGSCCEDSVHREHYGSSPMYLPPHFTVVLTMTPGSETAVVFWDDYCLVPAMAQVRGFEGRLKFERGAREYLRLETADLWWAVHESEIPDTLFLVASAPCTVSVRTYFSEIAWPAR